MLRPWLLHGSRARGRDPRVCLICLAARHTESIPAIDPVTALSLAAEVTLAREMQPCLAEPVVTRLLALTEAEAAELLAAVPGEVRETDASGESCPLRAHCAFWNLAAGYVHEASA